MFISINSYKTSEIIYLAWPTSYVLGNYREISAFIIKLREERFEIMPGDRQNTNTIENDYYARESLSIQEKFWKDHKELRN